MTGFGGSPNSFLNDACCETSNSAENLGPIYPKVIYAMIIPTRDNPMTRRLKATPFMCGE